MLEDGAVLVLPLATVRIVVDARTIVAIEDAERVEGRRSDLATWLGLEITGERRRALRVEGHDGWVVVGDDVKVRRVPDAAFRPLPSWLAAIGERLQLSALVALDDGFAYAMDLEQTFDRSVDELSHDGSNEHDAPTGALL